MADRTQARNAQFQQASRTAEFQREALRTAIEVHEQFCTDPECAANREARKSYGSN